MHQPLDLTIAPTINELVEWESGEIPMPDEVNLFARLFNSGLIRGLQGVYWRRLTYFVNAGFLRKTLDGKLEPYLGS